MNNPDIYDAAYAGCFGGSSGRIFRSTTPIDYDNYILAVKAFALAVDALIPPNEEGFTDAAQDLLMELCHGFWNDRFPQNQDPAFYNVQAIVTLFNEALFFLA
jgi:hypothetical protein